jgi:hypothetical protein
LHFFRNICFQAARTQVIALDSRFRGNDKTGSLIPAIPLLFVCFVIQRFFGCGRAAVRPSAGFIQSGVEGTYGIMVFAMPSSRHIRLATLRKNPVFPRKAFGAKKVAHKAVMGLTERG